MNKNNISLRRFFVIFVISFMLTIFTGCVMNKNDYAFVYERTPKHPDYEYVVNRIHEYESAFADYEENNSWEIKTSDGIIPSGTTVEGSYHESKDGSLKWLRYDIPGACDADLYVTYHMIDDMVFIESTSEGTDWYTGEYSKCTFKYVVINERLYSINNVDSSLDRVENQESKGFYLSFEEIIDIYSQ